MEINKKKKKNVKSKMFMQASLWKNNTGRNNGVSKEDVKVRLKVATAYHRASYAYSKVSFSGKFCPRLNGIVVSTVVVPEWNLDSVDTPASLRNVLNRVSRERLIKFEWTIRQEYGSYRYRGFRSHVSLNIRAVNSNKNTNLYPYLWPMLRPTTGARGKTIKVGVIHRRRERP